jgi:branched-chain amino acid aminotransferase
VLREKTKQKMEKVFLNNKLIDIDKACISVKDSGFLYGSGLFETMRCNNGVVFCLDDHLDRLFTSAVSLSISNTYDRQFIIDAIYKVLKANELTDARLRLTLTSGPMSASDGKSKSTLLITATDLQPYPAEYYQKGVLVVLCPFRQNVTEPIFGHKTTSYFSRMLALQIAHQKKAAEALWFTTTNILAEGCISNVFLVKDSVIYTPLLTTPALAGVARKSVSEISAENSIKLVEKNLSIDDMLAADEVFLTNVIMKIMPVNSVEKHTVGNGKVGPVTKKMQKLFDNYVKAKCSKSQPTS